MYDQDYDRGEECLIFILLGIFNLKTTFSTEDFEICLYRYRSEDPRENHLYI